MHALYTSAYLERAQCNRNPKMPNLSGCRNYLVASTSLVGTLLCMGLEDRRALSILQKKQVRTVHYTCTPAASMGILIFPAKPLEKVRNNWQSLKVFKNLQHQKHLIFLGTNIS